jgi:hypothetical protein
MIIYVEIFTSQCIYIYTLETTTKVMQNRCPNYQETFTDQACLEPVTQFEQETLYRISKLLVMSLTFTNHCDDIATMKAPAVCFLIACAQDSPQWMAIIVE